MNAKRGGQRCAAVADSDLRGRFNNRHKSLGCADRGPHQDLLGNDGLEPFQNVVWISGLPSDVCVLTVDGSAFW